MSDEGIWEDTPCPFCGQPIYRGRQVICIDCAVGDLPRWVPRCLACRQVAVTPEIAKLAQVAVQSLIADDCGGGWWHAACAPPDLRRGS